MSPCELTSAVTALANIIASKLSDDEVAVLAPVLTQLGDTLATIIVQREICDRKALCKGQSSENQTVID